MELLYFYMNHEEIELQKEINFSKTHIFTYAENRISFNIRKQDSIEDYYGEYVQNMYLLIGKNGTGKTTVLDFLALQNEHKKNAYSDSVFWFAVYKDESTYLVEGWNLESITHFQDLQIPFNKTEDDTNEPYSYFLYQNGYIELKSDLYKSSSTYLYVTKKEIFRSKDNSVVERKYIQEKADYLYNYINSDLYDLLHIRGKKKRVGISFNREASFADMNWVYPNCKRTNPRKYLEGDGEASKLNLFFINILEHIIYTFYKRFFMSIAGVSNALFKTDELNLEENCPTKFESDNDKIEYLIDTIDRISHLTRGASKDIKDCFSLRVFYHELIENVSLFEFVNPYQMYFKNGEIEKANKVLVHYERTRQYLVAALSQDLFPFFLEECSSGERNIIELFSSLYNCFSALDEKLNVVKNWFIVIDEPDNTLHPEWIRNLVSMMVEQINYIGETALVDDAKYNIILSSHSPLLASDFFVDNIFCFDLDSKVNHPSHGLGSGIGSLFMSDFIMDYPIGAYFSEKLQYFSQIMDTLKLSEKDSRDLEIFIESVTDVRIKETLKLKYTSFQELYKKENAI